MSIRFLRDDICWVSFFIYECFFHITRFFLSSVDSHGTLHLTLNLLSMQSTAAFILAVTKFSYFSFGTFDYMSPEVYQVGFLKLTYIYSLYHNR